MDPNFKMIGSTALVLPILAFALAGCTVGVVQNKTESSTISSIPETLPDDVTPEGVVLAAMLIKTSDITKAVENGLVTPAEVDFALAAIKSNSLQEWVDLAQSEQ